MHPSQPSGRRSRRRAPNHATTALALTVALLVAALGLVPAVAQAAPCRPNQEGCDADPGGGGGGGGGGPVLGTPTAHIADRTDTSITVRWIVSDAAISYRLEELVGGNWSTVQTYRQGGAASFLHGGLTRDSRHCYRVVARAGAVTRTSGSACAWTKDGLFLRPIWRVQVRITTGDVPNGDTDDDVRVGVHGPINGHSGGSTWIDWARDDFERGDTHMYDLINLVGITDLGDIEGLEIHKPGTDDWCLQDISLLVNDEFVFFTGFGDPCQWVNGGATELIQIPHDALRAYPLWGPYIIPFETMLNGNYATLIISHDQLEGRLESQVGDAMVGKEAYWAPPDAVELTRWDDQRAKVDLDLKGEAPGHDADIDVDFDLDVATHKDDDGKWYVDVSVANANATVSPAWYHYLFVAMSAGIEISAPERQIESAFSGIAVQMGIGNFYDLDATFDANHNLVIVATLQCPPSHPRGPCLNDDPPYLPT
jgi:hypothetical protein